MCTVGQRDAFRYARGEEVTSTQVTPGALPRGEVALHPTLRLSEAPRRA